MSDSYQHRNLYLKWNPPHVFEPGRSIQPGQGLEPPKHTHTLILLHGIECKVEEFARTYMEQSGQGGELSTVKFVFPSRERTDTKHPDGGVFDRWIGVGSEPDLGQLKDCCRYVKRLIDAEAKILNESGTLTRNEGYDRVLVGGYGDGASVALYSILGGSAKRRLAGYIGIDGGLPCPAGFTSEMKYVQRNINLFREPLGYRLITPRTHPGSHNDWALDARSFDHLLTPVFLGKGPAGSEGAEGARGYEVHRILTMSLGMDVIYQEVYDAPSESQPRWAQTIAGLKNEMFGFLDGKARIGSTKSTDLASYIKDDLCDYYLI